MGLIEMIRVVPVHSADCERAFSHMKMVKSSIRSRLGQVALTSLLRVQIESPAIEDFDPEEALQVWVGSGQRSKRPNYMDDCEDSSASESDDGTDWTEPQNHTGMYDFRSYSRSYLCYFE